jgi:hypothetical protein
MLGTGGRGLGAWNIPNSVSVCLDLSGRGPPNFEKSAVGAELKLGRGRDGGRGGDTGPLLYVCSCHQNLLEGDLGGKLQAGRIGDRLRSAGIRSRVLAARRLAAETAGLNGAHIFITVEYGILEHSGGSLSINEGEDPVKVTGLAVGSQVNGKRGEAAVNN